MNFSIKSIVKFCNNNMSKIRKFINNPIFYIATFFHPVVLFIYRRIIMPFLVNRLRKKDKVSIAFVIEELGSWKTEKLYLQMLNDSRFQVYLLLAKEQSASYAFDILKSYLEKKHYDYHVVEAGDKIRKKCKPDIIFYQKPYDGIIDHSLFYQANFASLFCFISYTFWNRCSPKINQLKFLQYVWQLYIENESVYNDLEPVMNNHAENMVVTGVPFMDILLRSKDEFDDPWKTIGKKRIIYAPHHTIFSESYKSPSYYDYSTFFKYAEFILEMAYKYRKDVEWAFKPHPLLRMKLNIIWGKDKTDQYFRMWEDLENAQVSEGEYMGLFKHSDAMIHDCGSFKIEYLYTDNPVMYLLNNKQEYDFPNTQTQEALNLHYKASNKKDIENFILNVIKGEDSLKELRKVYKSKFLTPPNNATACDNIINEILAKVN